MNKWLSLVKILAPIIVSVVKPQLAPIIEDITDAIGEAEELKKDGAITDKMAHVKKIANDAANVVNTVQGKEVLDKEELDAAVDDAVSTVVSVANLVSKKSEL